MRWFVLLGIACGGDKTPDPEAGDSAVAEVPPLEGPLLMVSETTTGRLIFQDTQTGARVGAQCLTEIHPERCAKGSRNLSEPCLMFAAVPEVDAGTDVLTLSYTMRNPEISYAPGAMARIRPGHPPAIDWVITDLDIPEVLQAAEMLDCSLDPEEARCNLFGTHIAVPEPTGGVIVADTSNSRILWVSPPADDSETGTVTAILSQSHPDWNDAQFVNHLQRIESGDSTWLLATFKGQKDGDEDSINLGRVVLWDVTDPADPVSLWTYPGTGSLGAVHHASMHETPTGPLLLYAHSLGASATSSTGAGSVGIAQWHGTDPPVYLGDGILGGGEELGFVRSVAWNENAGAMLITDSGCEHGESPCGRSSIVVLATAPEMEAPELSGAWTSDHASQRFIELDRMPLSSPEDLQLPFSSELIPLSQLGSPLGDEALGRCP